MGRSIYYLSVHRYTKDQQRIQTLHGIKFNKINSFVSCYGPMVFPRLHHPPPKTIQTWSSSVYNVQPYSLNIK